MDKTRAKFFENLATYLSDAVIILRLASFVVTQVRPIFDGGRLSIVDSSEVWEEYSSGLFSIIKDFVLSVWEERKVSEHANVSFSE